MSPWTILGWILVALIGGPITLRILIGLGELVAALVRDLRRNRRRKAAHRGRVRCEWHDCDATATRAGLGGYCCEDSRHISLFARKGSASYAPLLDHARKDKP